MRRYTSTFICLLVGATGVFGPAGVSAQAISVAGGLGHSGFAELGSPLTVAFHGRLPLSPAVAFPLGRLDAEAGLELVFGGRFAGERGEEVGTTCDHYWPDYAGCLEEPIARDAQLLQLEMGVGAVVAVGRLEVRGAVLGAQTLLMADSEGTETGRSPGRYYPDSTHRGLAVAAEVAWWVRPDQLAILGRVRGQPLDFHGCVTDTGTPFCGGETMLMVELGVSFVPRLEPSTR